MPIFNDSELGPTPVRPSPEPLMPWLLVWIIVYALAFLTLGGLAIAFYQIAHPAKTEIPK